jgi:hypothetical protein
MREVAVGLVADPDPRRRGGKTRGRSEIQADLSVAGLAAGAFTKGAHEDVRVTVVVDVSGRRDLVGKSQEGHIALDHPSGRRREAGGRAEVDEGLALVVCPLSRYGAPMMTSSYPSPLTSPAVETVCPKLAPACSPSADQAGAAASPDGEPRYTNAFPSLVCPFE